jgi:hypothetical protein
MSTEKKSEKWKTFFAEEKQSGVQSFSLPTGWPRVPGTFRYGVWKQKTCHTEAAEKRRKRMSHPHWFLSASTAD